MKRLFACVVLVAGFGACDATGPSEAERLSALYESAALEFGVPRSLLESVGFVESGWGAVERPGCHGVMGLCDGQMLDDAVRLSGLSADAIRNEAEANVRASAALLREAADGASEGGAVDWRRALESYAGRDAAWMAAVLDAFENGASARLADGSTLGVGGFATRAGDPTGKITGTVFSNEGGCRYSGGFKDCNVKLAGATVKLQETGETKTTDSNGSFTFVVPYGNYHVSGSKEGFENADAVLGVRTVDASTPVSYASIILPKIEKATVSGFVYEKNATNPADRSKRVAGAALAMGAVTGTSGADGAFTLTVPAGTETLSVSKAKYDSHAQSVTVTAGQTLSLEIGLVAEVDSNPGENPGGEVDPEEPARSGVDGVVKDEVTGWPVADVVVTVGEESRTTDALGAFAFDLDAGAHELSLQKPGYVAKTVSVTVADSKRETTNVFLAPSAPGPLLTITSPAKGSVFTASLIQVRGNVALGPDPVVQVNGVEATVSGGEFLAHVTLKPGENTLEATARTADGRSASSSVRVTFVAGASDDEGGCATAAGSSAAALLLLLLSPRRRRSS